MIAVWVTFRYESDFNVKKLRKLADGARPQFEKMPGLRSKTFTLRPEKREAVNFYVWDSEAAAKAFFSDRLLEAVTELYGVRPQVEYAEVAAYVSNA